MFHCLLDGFRSLLVAVEKLQQSPDLKNVSFTLCASVVCILVRFAFFSALSAFRSISLPGIFSGFRASLRLMVSPATWTVTISDGRRCLWLCSSGIAGAAFIWMMLAHKSSG